jgi:hypothetical protein
VPRIDVRVVDGSRWQNLMVRLLEDRLWLADHLTPTVVPLTTPTPSELLDRRNELQQLLASAPADQRQFIDRIVHSQLDSTQIHDYLTAAMAVQDRRRDWILSNWPHLVELEQVTQLIAAGEPLAHWPTAQPGAVSDVLEQLRQLAPSLDAREERTLADLDRQEAASDPVLELEIRRTHLRQLAARTASPIESEAIDNELADLSDRLRISQPTWLIDRIRHLHDNHQLTGCDVAELATQIIQAAAHCDLHGQLPATWPAPSPPAVDLAMPALELG